MKILKTDQKNLVLVCIFFRLIFYPRLSEIPLVAYHSIQKEKLCPLDQKIKSPYPLLIIQHPDSKRFPVSHWNFERTRYSSMLNYFQWKERMFWSNFVNKLENLDQAKMLFFSLLLPFFCKCGFLFEEYPRNFIRVFFTSI